MKASVIAVAFAAMSAAPALADQTLYEQTDDGWYVYVEDRSCVAYVDHEFADGDSTMMRFSSRLDEDRTYFSIVSEDWQMLAPMAGQGLTLYLDFPEANIAYGSAGMVMVNPDGRVGFTAANFDIKTVQDQIRKGHTLRVTVQMPDKPLLNVATLDIGGADKAMAILGECSGKNFARMAAR